jgi:hypothetical protein
MRIFKRCIKSIFFFQHFYTIQALLIPASASEKGERWSKYPQFEKERLFWGNSAVERMESWSKFTILIKICYFHRILLNFFFKKIKKFNVLKMCLFLIICENFHSIWLFSSNFVETCSFWVIFNILEHLRNFDFPRVVLQIWKYLSVELTEFSFQTRFRIVNRHSSYD